ncbi:SNF2 family N-terminal domain-containing protein [Tricharina praecox]|uniref:SNF2 family N-terminal domain-containing protein n=1 Tax=Tricharina praecox TaxID=43433 RepID=UPI00221F1924|nr:SNF2 family N-terminal domain-containing protein [Tricharina praecox]KAI5842022.1 SNF2 family N-terminal domain-containing protein [Tricharina praecox]
MVSGHSSRRRRFDALGMFPPIYSPVRTTLLPSSLLYTTSSSSSQPKMAHLLTYPRLRFAFSSSGPRTPRGVLEGKGEWSSARNMYIDRNDAPRNDALIVLDEAQTIRSIESANYNTVDAVKAHSRWVLTGTPVANGLMDLWILICLLQTRKSLEHRDTFRSLCPTPLQLKKRPRMTQKSQEVMRAYGLRTKSIDFIQLKMPTMTA